MSSAISGRRAVVIHSYCFIHNFFSDGGSDDEAVVEYYLPPPQLWNHVPAHTYIATELSCIAILPELLRMTI
jgi:hypothetical protein